jgi:hypothetical protein
MAVTTKSWQLIAACLLLGNLAMTFHGPGFRTNYLDLTRLHSGVFGGVGNSLATLPGYVGPLFQVRLLEQYGSWAMAFLSVAAVDVAAVAVVAAGFSTGSLDGEVDPLPIDRRISSSAAFDYVEMSMATNNIDPGQQPRSPKSPLQTQLNTNLPTPTGFPVVPTGFPVDDNGS